jgi:predicted kinase
MRTIYVTKGLPGSGKSTWAKELLKKEPDRWKRVNRDDLRGMLDDGRFSKDNEEYVRTVQDIVIRNVIAEGYDVIVDNTHLVPTTLKKIHFLAESIGDVKVIEKGFNVSVEECLARNSKREGRARVPDDTIKGMAKGAGLDRSKKLVDKEVYYPPRDGFQMVEQDESLPKAILCDLDGTLALMGDRSPFDASECDVKDKPNWAVINCVLAMHAQGVRIIFMSGRDSKDREPTVRFIEQWCQVNSQPLTPGGPVPAIHEVIPYELHMRGHADQRKDSIIKSELFEAHVAGKYNVLFILDDRNQVVTFWRSIGLTCFQVNYGDF